MALEEIVVGSADVVIRNLTNVIAAFGGVLFLYLVFQVINFFMKRKQAGEIKSINEKLDEVLKILKKKKNN